MLELLGEQSLSQSTKGFVDDGFAQGDVRFFPKPANKLWLYAHRHALFPHGGDSTLREQSET